MTVFSHEAYLCRLLHEAGATLTIADIDAVRTEQVVASFAAQAVAPSVIHAAEADIFAPASIAPRCSAASASPSPGRFAPISSW